MPISPAKKKKLEERARRAHYLYTEEAMSLRDIAKMMGVTHGTVWNMLNSLKDRAGKGPVDKSLLTTVEQ